MVDPLRAARRSCCPTWKDRHEHTERHGRCGCRGRRGRNGRHRRRRRRSGRSRLGRLPERGPAAHRAAPGSRAREPRGGHRVRHRGLRDVVRPAGLGVPDGAAGRARRPGPGEPAGAPGGRVGGDERRFVVAGRRRRLRRVGGFWRGRVGLVQRAGLVPGDRAQRPRRQDLPGRRRPDAPRDDALRQLHDRGAAAGGTASGSRHHHRPQRCPGDGLRPVGDDLPRREAPQHRHRLPGARSGPREPPHRHRCARAARARPRRPGQRRPRPRRTDPRGVHRPRPGRPRRGRLQHPATAHAVRHRPCRPPRRARHPGRPRRPRGGGRAQRAAAGASRGRRAGRRRGALHRRPATSTSWPAGGAPGTVRSPSSTTPPSPSSARARRWPTRTSS